MEASLGRQDRDRQTDRIESDDADELAVGQRLRHLRRAAGMRLRDVAERAQCSESMLSKIETGQVSPSINMLHRIARILNVNMAMLFEPTDHATPFVQRQGRRPTILGTSIRRGDGISLESLTPYEIHGHLQGQLHVLAPGGASDGMIQHEGEEMGYVVEGTLELTVDNQTVNLTAGDSFFFDSRRPHGYRNPGPDTARVVWVNSPPTY